jgi:hypothetical protein
MPTNKPRVQVTLEPETHAVIERLAQLQGRTRGAIIAELLDSIAPTLTRTVALLEAAIEAPNDVKRGLKAMVEGVHQELVEVSGDASAQLDMLLDQLTNVGPSGAADPHVVTRGSGIEPPTPQKGPKKPRKRSKPGDSANG